MPKGKYTRRKLPPRVRFYKKIDRTGDCWLWVGGFRLDGYGNFYMESNKWLGAHRSSWIIHKGKIPRGMFVLHRCDNRACVNPDHLFLGTQRDNIYDCIAKGRNFVLSGRPGELNGRAILNEKDVREIRANDTDSYKTLAMKYGVRFTTIGKIKRRELWKHLS